MDILFGSKKLQRLCTSRKEATREWGERAAKQTGRRLDDLRAAANLEQLRNAPGKYHELKGSRSGQVAISVGGGLRLIIEPADASSVLKEDGGLDWGLITSLIVVGVEDYHDG